MKILLKILETSSHTRGLKTTLVLLFIFVHLDLEQHTINMTRRLNYEKKLHILVT